MASHRRIFPPDDGASKTTDRPVLSLIRDIQSCALSPGLLERADRRRCVEELTANGGYSISQIAEILQVTERTVSRDRSDIRKANALKVGPGFAGEMAGSLLRDAEGAIARLRQLGRGADTPAAMKIECERTCWDIARQLVDTLQKLGFLPAATTRIEGEITHHCETPSAEDIQTEIRQLIVVAEQSGDANAIAETRSLAQESDLLLMADRVEELDERLRNGDEHPDDTKGIESDDENESSTDGA